MPPVLAELAAARGISVAAARRLTQRHRWGRHTGNDGFVRVSVPLTALGKARKSAAVAVPTTRYSDSAERPTSDTMPDPTREIAGLLAQIADLRTRLDASEADRRRLTELLTGTTDTTREVEGLRTQVADLRRRLECESPIADAGSSGHRFAVGEPRASPAPPLVAVRALSDDPSFLPRATVPVPVGWCWEA